MPAVAVSAATADVWFGPEMSENGRLVQEQADSLMNLKKNRSSMLTGFNWDWNFKTKTSGQPDIEHRTYVGFYPTESVQAMETHGTLCIYRPCNLFFDCMTWWNSLNDIWIFAL